MENCGPSRRAPAKSLQLPPSPERSDPGLPQQLRSPPCRREPLKVAPDYRGYSLRKRLVKPRRQQRDRCAGRPRSCRRPARAFCPSSRLNSAGRARRCRATRFRACLFPSAAPSTISLEPQQPTRCALVIIPYSRIVRAPSPSGPAAQPQSDRRHRSRSRFARDTQLSHLRMPGETALCLTKRLSGERRRRDQDGMITFARVSRAERLGDGVLHPASSTGPHAPRHEVCAWRALKEVSTVRR
jgi:hypothetical protein